MNHKMVQKFKKQHPVVFHEFLLAPSFEPVAFQPSFSICSRTFLTGFCHFHGSTQSGPFQVANTLGYRFEAVASKLGYFCTSFLLLIRIRGFFVSNNLELVVKKN